MNTITLDHIEQGALAAIAARRGKPTDGYWYNQRHFPPFADGSRECGTACCVAGHIAVAAGIDWLSLNRPKFWDVITKCRKLVPGIEDSFWESANPATAPERVLELVAEARKKGAK